MGQGWDRHLDVIRSLAQQKGGEEPHIFSDDAFGKIKKNVIVSSAVVSCS